MLSESALILWNLNFCEQIFFIDILETYWSTKPSNLRWKIYSKKSLYILEDGASGVQVGDTEQVIVQGLLSIW